MKIEVDTMQYLSAHGKAPRGIGSWIFAIGRDGAWTDYRAPSMTSYSTAKRLAIAEARGLGASIVVVQS